MYYNTTSQTGAQLNRQRNKALSQREQILGFFQRHPGKWYCPHEFLTTEVGLPYMTPLTSVRRTITDLTDEGLLEKSEAADAIGSYGKPVHRWRLK